MTKNEFIQKLGYLLKDIPEEERREAMEFYENYLEEAGPLEEEKVIMELGSPEEVADSIMKALEYGGKDTGYFAEDGYHESYREKTNLPVFSRLVSGEEAQEKKSAGSQENRRQENGQQKNGQQEKYRSSSTWQKSNNTNREKKSKKTPLDILLLVVLILFAVPIGLPVLLTVFSLLLAVIITVVSIWITFLAVSVSLLAGGILLAIVGIVQLAAAPVLGLSLTGGGFILLGVGLLFSIATIWMAGKALPAIFRWIKDFCKRLFHRGRVYA